MYTAIGICHAENNGIVEKQVQPHISADLQPTKYIKSYLTNRSIFQHQHTKKPFPSQSCQKPVNINGMFNKFTLYKNLCVF